MKQRIRLTESQLHKIIRKCVNEALIQEGYKDWLTAGVLGAGAMFGGTSCDDNYTDYVNEYAKVTRPVTMKDVQDLIKARGGNPNDQYQIEQAQEQLENEREERIRDFEQKHNVKH